MSEIVIICASDHHNLALAKQFEAALADRQVSSRIVDLVSLNLPLYTSEREKSDGIPTLVSDLLSMLSVAKGYVWVAPEYNGGPPPVFSNFIAWVSRASSDWRGCFNGRVAAIASFSGSGQNVLQIMRLQLAYIGLTVLGRQLMVSNAKPLKPESLDAVVDELVRLARI